MSFSLSANASLGPLSAGLSVGPGGISGAVSLGLGGADGVVPELLDATWRGIPFNMLTGDDESAGRRVVRTLFPGKDQKATQDLGLDSGPIAVNGRVIGDDYIDRTQALRDAFDTPGPGLLVHPWLGEILVIATARPKFSYDQTELRVIHFTAVFELYDAPTPAPTDTLAASQDAWEGLQESAQDLLGTVLQTASLTLAAIGAVETVCSLAAGIWSAVAGSNASLAGAAAAPITALGTVGEVAPGAGYPAAVGALLAAPSAALVGLSETVTPAAIGPGDLPPATITVDPRITATAILSACTQLTALGGNTAPQGVVALAAAAIAAGDAASAASDIAFTSQQDAAAWLSQLVATIGAVASLAVTFGPSQPVGAGQVWNACQTLMAAVTADINADIGRLPTVQAITLIASTPVWLVAQGLYGDTPGQLLANYADLVARNAVANPALMGPGQIEALVA